jgi:hypothetical protein
VRERLPFYERRRERQLVTLTVECDVLRIRGEFARFMVHRRRCAVARHDREHELQAELRARLSGRAASRATIEFMHEDEDELQ